MIKRNRAGFSVFGHFSARYFSQISNNYYRPIVIGVIFAIAVFIVQPVCTMCGSEESGNFCFCIFIPVYLMLLDN
ncbi:MULTISPECIES: hypothetical protein [Methanosarcina]|uniref:Uncharacterized protein n=2 Tax=Methanosarcina mazei TaxID=2209 RepID=A0A0F8GN18_METMZ|nr:MULTISPECIES: hypothetical protein [Methanosarcina]AGF97953.1 hypothetical protein MmTuc01_2663 [Methanosarcina mazei Tuc01]KKG02138.1 hypothetical protein DU47_03005 [Methanosarcina mazei]KKG03344.1 hypothetical protein DU31_12620 [Methanosarcina mazei]KKG04775.1 hypothetical protein DU40_20245 [Methanosarcina mazei]KKG07654.1 hypothetical protein DU34_12310 [Methanosarcina mazei]